jgi:hypothetical protein
MYAVAEPELPGEFESNAADSRLIAGGFEVFDDSAAVAAGEPCRKYRKYRGAAAPEETGGREASLITEHSTRRKFMTRQLSPEGRSGRFYEE